MRVYRISEPGDCPFNEMGYCTYGEGTHSCPTSFDQPDVFPEECLLCTLEEAFRNHAEDNRMCCNCRWFNAMVNEDVNDPYYGCGKFSSLINNIFAEKDCYDQKIPLKKRV